jgi:integrase
MPRPRVGSVYLHGDHFDIQITLTDGSRSKPMCQPSDMSETRARDKAKRLTEIATRDGATAAPKSTAKENAVPAGETFAAWAERWCTAREARGLTSVDDDRGRLRKWVAPLWGDKPIATLARADVEALVEDLDARVRAEELSWKTAKNVLGLVTKALADSCKSKVRALRVRESNPAADVEGPDRGVHKSKAYLYPADFVALVSCPKIPAAWRRMYGLAVYLYLRAAELRALEWTDLDLETGLLLVHRTEDEDGNVESTKGMRARRFSVEPALLPLLRRMHAAAGGLGRLVPRMPVEKHLAPMLRRHLLLAGVTRAELHAGDRTRKQMRFHDLRATGLTWMAIRGDDPLKIKQRAGHATFSTTEGYIREAEAVRDGFGEPFPLLPIALVSPDESPERFGANGHAYVMTKKFRDGEAGFEPATTSTQSSCTTGLCDSP